VADVSSAPGCPDAKPHSPDRCAAADRQQAAPPPPPAPACGQDQLAAAPAGGAGGAAAAGAAAAAAAGGAQERGPGAPAGRVQAADARKVRGGVCVCACVHVCVCIVGAPACRAAGALGGALELIAVGRCGTLQQA